MSDGDASQGLPRGKPAFEHPDVVDRLLEFFGDSPIVAHNAEFDRGFLNYELELMGRPPFPKERFTDTLVLARERGLTDPAKLRVVELESSSESARQLRNGLLEAAGLTASVRR